MKRLLTGLVAVLLVGAIVAPALAWEFELKGLYENRIRYFGRMGNDDLFGKTNLQEGQAGTFIGFAGPNIYGTGNRAPVLADTAGGLTMQSRGNPAMIITRGGFSRWGSDALYNDSRMSFEPTIRVNPAIRLKGVYNIGGIRNKYRQTGTNVWGDGVGVAPLERYYMSQTSMNATDGVFGMWEQFDMVAQTPWGIIVTGFRDFPWGTGATFDSRTRAEALLFVVPYGPLTFLYGIYPAWNGYTVSWDTGIDNFNKVNFQQVAAIAYNAGCLNVGALFLYRADHYGPGSSAGGTVLVPGYVPTYGGSTGTFNHGVNFPDAGDSILFAPYNRTTTVGEIHAKYFNGRFFANVEYAYANAEHVFVAAPPFAPMGHVTGGYAPIMLESNHWFSEIGAVAGPAKVSLLYALASGPVQDLLSSQAGQTARFGGLPVKLYCPLGIQTQAMEPYEFLMFNTYGGGNNGGWTGFDINFQSDEHGKMSDAYCFAGRVDYAVASNLNVWGTYIWAHRLERNGTVCGQYRDIGNGAAGGIAVTDAGGAPLFPNPFMMLYGGTTPWVPDGYIGWEAGAGVDWKLLEGFNLKLRYAYWQPGDWFDYAYQALIGPLAPGPGGSGILQGRSPINAFEGKMVVEF